MTNKELHIIHLKIGSKVRELRDRKGISQLKLGTEVDLSKTHIGRIERGETNVTIQSLIKIATFFRIDFTDFFKD